MSSDTFTSPKVVRAVIEDPDPVRRNLLITQSYSELAVELHELLGGEDVTWCSFAVWASKEAGAFIRNEQVPGSLRRFLRLENGADLMNGRNGHRRNRGRARPLLGADAFFRSHPFLVYTRTTLADVAAHVASGNRLVYAKLAPIFAEFLNLARASKRPDFDRLEIFLEDFSRDVTTSEKLRRAFRHYYTALFETDSKIRAERIFLANTLVGWHEQIRLQEAIDRALAAPIRRAFADPERRLSRWPWPDFALRTGVRFSRKLFRRGILRFEEEWKRAATECMMSLGLPGIGRLELGEDLPRLPDGSMFPPVLRRISHPEAPVMLAALDRTPESLRGTAVDDWSRLGDRMNFIVDYFRSRQRSAELLQPPFSQEQIESLRRGRWPEGPL